MIVNYSIQQAIGSLHHARSLNINEVLLWRTVDLDGLNVLLVIPFYYSLHHGIFDHNHVRRIEL